MDIHHRFTVDILTIPYCGPIGWLIHTTCQKTIPHFTIKIILTINKTFHHEYSPHFTMGIINHTIPWANTMVHQYHMPKMHLSYRNQIIL